MSEVKTLVTLVLGGALDNKELGDIDIVYEAPACEELQRELVVDSDDVHVELVSRIAFDAAQVELAALREELDNEKSENQHLRNRIDELVCDKQILQATIDTLTQDFKELGERYSKLQTGEDSMLHRVIAERDAYKAEIERLKGGQGEPVAWVNSNDLINDGYSHSFTARSEQPANNYTDGGVPVALYTSQPAPVSSELVQLLERAKVYARGPFLDEINACLEKQREPVSVVLTDEQILETMRPAIYRADGGYIFDTAKDDVIAAGRSLIDKVKELNT